MVELECLPYGAGQQEEGICLLVRMGLHRILLDCGLANLAPLLQNAGQEPPVDLVICSHAHRDHAKGLLELHRAFPQIPIYASEVTTQLLPLNWLNQSDVPAFCHALPWRSPVEFREGLSAELIPAGHLPGAAAILLTYATPERSYTLFYTGDFLLSNSRLVDGLPLEELRGLKPDVLILEGTYGTARYPHRRQQENQLAERIHHAIVEGQSVLLPTPTLGLGQEILMLLRSHHHFTGRDVDIWVAGSVAMGCNAYLDMLSHFPSSVQNFARHQPLFWDERIRPRVRHLHLPETGKTSGSNGGKTGGKTGGNGNGNLATLNRFPCIVLTDQEADLSTYCQPDSGSWLVLVPQQLGRSAIDPALLQRLENSPTLNRLLQSGQLSIESYFLGDHCDGTGTTQLIHNLRPQHVVFVHGSPAYLNDLTSLEELQNRYHLHTPAAGVRVELPIGETFIQPAAPDTRYEGELSDQATAITIVLPEAITSDPRWQNFADTGLIEARWQGEELILRGLHQRELLNQSSESSLPRDVECCENCLHFRGQRCWNQASPLFGFKVTPEGYCPGFEAVPIRQSDR